MLLRILRLAAALAVLVLLGLGSTQAVPGASAQGEMQGDVTCDSSVNSVDSLQILRDVAGLGTTAGCLAVAGDVNCDGAVNSVDALRILRYVAGLPVTAPDGCAPIGDPLGPLTPQALAARLNAATDTDHAEALLRLVYPEIDVGLYTGAGQQILAGAETGLDDFYLYDFESGLLAGNFVDHQLFRLDTTTLFLGKAGVVDPNTSQPFTDGGLLLVLAAKVTAARADETQFAWRLIDELGLGREEPLDLTEPGLDPETTFLDSVQTFLILYDMTLGLPAAARGPAAGISAAAAPPARTKALHDYSWATQSYSFRTSALLPTHWKHDKSSDAEERTLVAFLGYRLTDESLAPLAGPLAGFDEEEVLGTTGGRPVKWQSWTLVPRNGTWRNLEDTNFTDAAGFTRIVFVPKVECALAVGKGAVKTQIHTVNVEIKTLIGDFYAPDNAVPDVVTVRAQIRMKVSHHTGKAAQSGAVAVSSEGITSLDDLPCEWTGTAHGKIHHYSGASYDEVGEIDGTFTFGNPELTEHGNVVTYEVTSGSATWHASGHSGSCSFSKSGTEEVAGGGALSVSGVGSGQLTYGGMAGTVGQDRDMCDYEVRIIQTVIFFSTCGSAGPLTGLDLSGSCNSDYPGNPGLWHDEFDWHLTAGSCSAAAAVTPEGTCGS